MRTVSAVFVGRISVKFYLEKRLNEKAGHLDHICRVDAGVHSRLDGAVFGGAVIEPHVTIVQRGVGVGSVARFFSPNPDGVAHSPG